jgi:ribosomal protein S20
MRTRVKRARTVIASGKSSSEEIQESVLAALRQLALAASKGVIHKRTAARKISRLTLALNKSSVDRKAASSSTPKKTVKHKGPAKAGEVKPVETKAPAKAAETKAPAKAETKAPTKAVETKAPVAKATETKAPAKKAAASEEKAAPKTPRPKKS